MPNETVERDNEPHSKSLSKSLFEAHFFGWHRSIDQRFAVWGFTQGAA